MSDNSENNGELEKLDLTTPNFTDQNIMRIAELFPNVVTESRDEGGAVKHAIDFDALKQELSDNIVEGSQERYQLNWPGKRKAMLTANAPINKTLRPCREESVDFDTTKNLFIEGDNLDALKLLQETYLGKVKMIYIDPPYNTGKDFIYKDNFTVNKDEYLEESGQRDEHGGRLVANPESNGRYHSDWLSMMYPRLKLARNLLRDDGCMMISINEVEYSSAKRLCDEIIGEDSFVCSLIWKSRQIVDSRNKSNASTDHEYILVYARNIQKFRLLGEAIDLGKYSNRDDDSRGPWMSNSILGLAAASQRPNLHYNLKNPDTGLEYPCPPDSGWRYSRETMSEKIEQQRIIFPAKPDGRPREKKFLNELDDTQTGISSILPVEVGFTLNGSRECRELMGEKYFDFPKPLSLITKLIEQADLMDGDIVLDFFCGSGSTFHAACGVASAKNIEIKSVAVQIAQRIEEKSEAFRAGFETIADLAKERLRLAGEALTAQRSQQPKPLDVGFRVLKIESSNMTDVWHSPEQVSQNDLLSQVSNIKPDRSGEDLLFQVLLDWGVDLTLPIARESIEGKEVFFVDENALAACFDTGVTEELVKQIAQRKPLRVVFRDDGFDSDATKINVEQLFKHLSPHTEVKVI